MPIYKINGEVISVEQLEQEAQDANLSFDDYIAGIDGLEIEEEVAKELDISGSFQGEVPESEETETPKPKEKKKPGRRFTNRYMSGGGLGVGGSPSVGTSVGIPRPSPGDEPVDISEEEYNERLARLNTIDDKRNKLEDRAIHFAKTKIKDEQQASDYIKKELEDFDKNNQPEKDLIFSNKEFDLQQKALAQLRKDTGNNKAAGRADGGDLIEYFSYIPKAVGLIDLRTEEASEVIKINKDVETAIATSLSKKGLQKLAMGAYTLQEKENLINEYKLPIIQKRAEVLSDEMLDLQAQAENSFGEIKNRQIEINKALSIIKNSRPNQNYTQEEVNKYNELSAKFKQLEASKPALIEKFEANFKAINTRKEILEGDYNVNLSKNIIYNNFELTNQVEKYRETYAGDGWWNGAVDILGGDVTQGIYSFIKKASIGNVAFFMTAFGDKFTDQDSYSRFDGFRDLVTNWTDYSLVPSSEDEKFSITKEGGGLKDDVSARSFLKLGAQMVPFTAYLMMEARKGKVSGIKQGVGKYLQGLKGNAKILTPLSKKLKNEVILADAAFRATVLDNAKEAKNKGLDGIAADTYAVTLSGIEAGVQSIMPDTNFLKGVSGKAIKDIFAGSLKNVANKKAASAASKQFLVNLGKEVGEEEINYGFNLLTDASFGLALPKGSEFLNAQIELGFGTLMLSSTFGSVGAVKTFGNQRGLIYNQISNNIESTDAYLEKMQETVTDPDIKEEVIAARKFASKIHRAVENSPENVTAEQIELLVEKSELLEKKENTDSAFHESIDNKISNINNKIKQSTIQQSIEKDIKIDIKLLNKSMSSSGLKVDDTIVFEAKENSSASSRQKEFLMNEAGYTEKQANAAKDSYGLFVTTKDGREVFVVNKDSALEDAMVTTGQHEFMHKILKQALKNDPALIKKASESLLKEVTNITGGQEAVLGTEWFGRWMAYTEKVEEGTYTIDSFYEEALPLFSEALSNKDIKPNTNALQKIADTFRQLFQNLGIKDINFETGEGVKNFIIDYNKAYSKGSFKGALKEFGASGKAKGVAEPTSDTSKTKPKAKPKAKTTLSINTLQEQLDDLDLYDFGGDEYAFNDAKTNLELKIKKAKQKELSKPSEPKEKVKSDTKKNEKPKGKRTKKISKGEIEEVSTKNKGIADKNKAIAEEMISLGVNRISEIKDKPTRERIKSELTENNMGAVKKLAAKAANVDLAGIDPSQQVGYDEFLSGFSAELAALINTYQVVIPSGEHKGKKTPFGAYMIGPLSARYGAILDKAKRGKIDKTASLSDDRVKEIEAEGPSKRTTPEGKKYKSLTNSNVVPNFTITAIKDKLTSIVRGLVSKITDTKGDNAATTPLIAEIKKKIGKVVGDPNAAPKLVIQRLGKLKDGTYKKNLIKNKKAIIENMTTTFLMGKDSGKKVSGGIPQAIEKSVGGKFTGKKLTVNVGGKEIVQDEFIPNFVPYPQWVGQKIDREKTLVRGATAGNEIVRRVSADKVSDADFVGLFIDEKGKLIRGKREALGKAIAEEIAFEILSKEIQNENSDISKAFEGNQEAKGAILSSTFVVELSRDIDRGTVKFNLRTGTHGTKNKALNKAKKKAFEYVETTGTVPTDDTGLFYLAGKDKILNGLLDDLKTAYTNYNKLENRASGWDLSSGISFNNYINNIIGWHYNKIDRAFNQKPGVAVVANRDTVAKSKEILQIFLEKSIKNGKFTKEDATKFLEMTQGWAVSGKSISIFGNNKTLLEWLQGSHQQQVVQDAFNEFKKVEVANGHTIHHKGGKALNIPEQGVAAKDIRSLTGKNPVNNIDLDRRDKLSERSKELVEEFATFLKDNIGTYDLGGAALILKTMGSSMRSPLKTAAKLDKAFLVEGLTYKDYVYEHGIPTGILIDALAEYIVNPKVDYGKVKEIVDKSTVNIVPDTVMNVVDFYYKSRFSTEGALDLPNPAVSRYFSEETAYRDALKLRGISNFTEENLINLRGLERGSSVKTHPKLSLRAKNDYLFTSSVKAVNAAIKNSLSNKPAKGISVWDFDDTLARTKSNVLYTMPDGTKGKLDAAEFAAKGKELVDQGAKFDFSEFSKVMKGKKGPMFDKAIKRNEKFGNDHVYILTARPANSRDAIHSFLKGIGLDIKVDNIIGLADGNPQAKADWMVTKAAEGYNDFYFADDHTGNTKAVKDVLNTLDVKSKVVQAKVQFSQRLDQRFNRIIQRKTGDHWQKEYSEVVSRRLGAKKGRWRIFLPPSADDFRGLTQYTLVGKGKQGESDQKFFERSLMNPYFKGVEELNVERQRIKDGTKALFRLHPGAKKKLRKLTANGEFTNDQAVRVYLWNKAGHTIPGISEKDQAALVDVVNKDKDLWNIASGAMQVAMVEEWTKPAHYWDAQTLLSDIDEIASKVNRKKYLAEFIENVDVIFSDKNLNKVEALFGLKLKEALKGSIQAMKSGSNRAVSTDRITNKWMNWINNSVGTIMFFNRRSATLQTLSIVNFLNWSDNNPAKAAVAFANQKQYWSDFAMIFNSAKLKQRRSGLKSDVQEAEIANAAATSGNKPQAVVSYLLKIGFTPTQIVDSFAISSGGASFYRNRLNTYLGRKNSEGGSLYTEKQAKEKAWLDFTKIADETQQSGDPALVSQEQRSVSGRLLLAFQNTSMQYTRLVKKAGLDLINGRGDIKTNISKMIYYSTVQSFIFNALASSLFALLPGFDEDDEDDDEKREAEKEKKLISIYHGMVDSTLKGSGMYGAIAAGVKNTIRKGIAQEDAGWKGDHVYTIIEALNMAPAIGSKFRKGYGAYKTYKWNKDLIEERPWDITMGGRYSPSPTYEIIGGISSAAFNLPLDRVIQESQAIGEALDQRNSAAQRMALAMGWKAWHVGAESEEKDLIHTQIKTKKKEKKAEEKKAEKAKEKQAKIDSIANLPAAEKKAHYDRIKAKRSASAKKAAATRKKNRDEAKKKREAALRKYLAEQLKNKKK